jgi:uncharacterized membrane protein
MLATKIATRAVIAIAESPKMNKNRLYAVLMVAVSLLALVGMMTIIVYINKLPHQRVYDCSIAEFAPDYPIEVREGCRKLRSGAKVV